MHCTNEPSLEYLWLLGTLNRWFLTAQNLSTHLIVRNSISIIYVYREKDIKKRDRKIKRES